MNAIPTWFNALLIGALVGFILHKTYEAGAEKERSKWVLDKALQTVSNQVALAKKNSDLRVLENRIASAAVEISTFHQGVMNEKIAQKDLVIAGLRNGTVRLSVPVTSTGDTCQGGISQPTSDRPEAVRETRAELSTAAAEFFVNLGHQCDAEVIHGNEVKDNLIECRAALQQLQLILRE